VPITHSTRSSITLEVDGRPVVLDAEAFLRGHGSPDFVVYSSSMLTWADGSAINSGDKERILEELRRSAAEKGWTIEIE
jgi:hypothetical protein